MDNNYKTHDNNVVGVMMLNLKKWSFDRKYEYELGSLLV